jgi:hypothetical protein
MIVALLGVLLVLGGLYVLTQNAPAWHQVLATVAQLAHVLPLSVWSRVEYFSAIGALVLGAALILMRLFGGLKHV